MTRELRSFLVTLGAAFALVFTFALALPAQSPGTGPDGTYVAPDTFPRDSTGHFYVSQGPTLTDSAKTEGLAFSNMAAFHKIEIKGCLFGRYDASTQAALIDSIGLAQDDFCVNTPRAIGPVIFTWRPESILEDSTVTDGIERILAGDPKFVEFGMCFPVGDLITMNYAGVFATPVLELPGVGE